MSQGLVLDGCAALAMAFEDERDDYTFRVFATLAKEGAWVPSHWPMEIVNVLRVSERRKRINAADSREFLRLLASLPIRVHPSGGAVEEMPALYEVAGRYSLTACDAAYLQLAMTLKLPLASKDDDLNEAAVAAKVPLYT